MVFGVGLALSPYPLAGSQGTRARLLEGLPDRLSPASPFPCAAEPKTTAARSRQDRQGAGGKQPTITSYRRADAAILQREGRLIVFLKEDCIPIPDDQIGAAVRSIHQGCKAALDEHLELEPILTEAEGFGCHRNRPTSIQGLSA